MKRIIIILAVGLLMMAACTGVKTVSKGLDNQSYIELIGQPGNYRQGVDLIIDDVITIKAEVNKAGAKRPKGSVYAVSSGKHQVTVIYQNEKLYSQQIFVSAQETKQIVLP